MFRGKPTQRIQLTLLPTPGKNSLAKFKENQSNIATTIADILNLLNILIIVISKHTYWNRTQDL